MRSKYGFLLLLVAGLAVFWSCKTPGTVTEAPPPAEPQASAPTGPDQAALNALDAAIARVEQERKLALDFRSSSYFSSEWSSVESAYNSVKVDRTSAAAVQDAAQRYNAAADTYHKLFQDTLPLYAADMEDRALKARDDAIAAGIEDYAPEYLDTADEIALSAESAFLAEDYYQAEAGAQEALQWYLAMKTGLDVVKAREDAIAAGISSEQLDAADGIALNAEDAFLAKDYQKAEADAQEALSRYLAVKK
jgi:hypothetical protein